MYMINEFKISYTKLYPITSFQDPDTFAQSWATNMENLHDNFIALVLGDGGLVNHGIGTNAIQTILSNVIFTVEKVKSLVNTASDSEKQKPEFKQTIISLMASIDETHEVVSEMLEEFLSKFIVMDTAESTTILLVTMCLSVPLIFILSFLMFYILLEYEKDNYEILQMFHSVPPDRISSSPSIKAYIMDSDLSKVDNSFLGRIFRSRCLCFGLCCGWFSKRSTSGADSSISSAAEEESFQISPHPVILCSDTGKIAFINAPALRTFEYESATEVVGVTVSQLFSHSSRGVVMAFFKNLQKNSETMLLGRRKTIAVKEEKLSGRRKTGKEFPCCVSIAISKMGGKIMIPLFLNDLTNEVSHEKLIQEEKAKSESLLLNILPAAVAKKLGEGETLICETFPDVSCFFSDIVGFTNMSSKITAWELVKLLNDIVNGFDDIAEQLGVEKIKTIGDAYFAVSGLHSNKNDHAPKLLLFAINARAYLEKVNRLSLPSSIQNRTSENDENNNSGASDEENEQTSTSDDPLKTPEKIEIKIRIGIHTGPVLSLFFLIFSFRFKKNPYLNFKKVVGGVIGKSKFQYDVWGSTVNLASRMESTGIPGKIQISRQTYERVHDIFKFEEREGVYAKGVGNLKTYILVDESISQDFFIMQPTETDNSLPQQQPQLTNEMSPQK